MKGTFIVIEGTDGSGKTTHLELAVKKLTADSRAVEVVDFPQYGKKSAGPVEEYLNGKYGSAQEVSPYVASLFYAVDRFDASFKINKALTDGKIVLANRYVPSNIAHQGAKITDIAERQKFMHWVEEIEYGIMKLPRPDRVIFLHVPAHISFELVEKKNERAYLQEGKKRDIHESDLLYQKAVEQSYLELAAHDTTVKTIECAPEGKLLYIEEIHPLVMKQIYDLFQQSA
ncbi:dTMP kinase [Candidatus Uhrbacteria bacterium RIFCSPLOWO2_01_FULL_47_24]|uniref:Thymidylate kinase n=1 Tax=Candidatus Uhrbacteria bacterium RIFCSPLOWO2_01_FULL_47_24 TaxID=1802401 RepID=A0A1F7UPE5_9BACT|nr:MAG: dTMP kinase [Candidatus Uhrbacteria bacterium RIFCSPHIGHO2_01_FULL_47_11]OGL67933.1 MAG: dTMP kinase [Candidatus Uhrbacteria bacterium RIFCSPHIGHO2_02_FULL_46_47]OGL75204.1 MAG: dTMP kinase [Candidatus Uhrbacteria bacterium RIFCSPHIGHO2_12_FULL_47_11]OGL80119.1 MAG: dTMP kinase [Candidatus Uhrbacteria bacterium RIFCSPLOWO2_01_FULL_47_24]OGL84904.1 MAG: dTMP kinase [Candidatus Uhrbacteria bacterium RIFCSPLOWO2_02_FULL_46_25]OGL92290.1 MAG: dTMP kinase [Candidatus Uhrbacteria bacterium R